MKKYKTMKTFDYSKTYYKITNKNECHNGYQYKDGLNVLNEPFNDNPEDSCCPGGFYFTDYDNLLSFLDYGIWIREVKIPEDARVIKDKSGDKWRTDKIILLNRYHIYNDFEKWFDKERFNYKDYSIYLATYFYEYFDIWWDKDKFDYYFSFYLAANYSEYFDKWWNPDKFNWEDKNYLKRYCIQYKHIWEKYLK